MRCRSWPPNKASPGPAFVVALDACGETGTLCVGRNTLGLTQFDGSLLAGHCLTARLRCGTADASKPDLHGDSRPNRRTHTGG
jgi:hypothetical protein